MATISFHQICITMLSLGLACGIIACATSRWLVGYFGGGSGLFDMPNDGYGNTVKAMTIIGVAFMGFGLLLEILMIVSNTFKLSKAINLLCLVCCIICVAALIIGLAVYASQYSSGGYSVWLLTASTVFGLEALFFYIVQWRCV